MTKISVLEHIGGHGGMFYYDFMLCQALKDLGMDVTLFTCDETEEDHRFNFRLIKVYRGIFAGRSRILQGLRFCKGSLKAALMSKIMGTRLFHLHFFQHPPLELFNAVLLKLLGFKIIVTVHDVENIDREKNPIKVSKKAYSLADAIIAHNTYSKESIARLYDIDRGKIFVIPHGNYVDYIRSIPDKTIARKRLNLNGFKHVILFFGQIRKTKGLSTLLHAFREVLNQCDNVVLVIAGRVVEGDFSPYGEIIRKLHLQDNIRVWLKYIPEEDVALYFSAADTVVLPYERIYQSGVLLMALSYGKAVIVTDIEGMKEIIEDGENGLLFPVGDSTTLARRILKLLQDQPLRLKLERQGYDTVLNNFSWNEIARKTIMLYNKVLTHD